MIRDTIKLGTSAFALALAMPALADNHEARDEAAMAAEPETPTMSFGSWGVDPELLSPQVDPGDDFFAYVNQEWLDANPLPAEYSIMKPTLASAQISRMRNQFNCQNRWPSVMTVGLRVSRLLIGQPLASPAGRVRRHAELP